MLKRNSAFFDNFVRRMLGDNESDSNCEEIKEVTVINDNDEVLAKIYFDDDEVKGIVQNGLKVLINKSPLVSEPLD